MSSKQPIGTSVRGLVVVMTMTMLTATILIPSFGILAPFLRDDLGISRTQIGWLVTVIAFVSAVASPPLGRLVDRVGGRRVVYGIYAASLLAGLCLAVSPSYLWLFGAALLGGLTNASANPTTNKLINLRLQAGSRGTAIGIKQSGVQAGIFLSALVLTPVALAFGWRSAAMTISLIALVGLIAAFVLLPRDDLARAVDDAGAIPDTSCARRPQHSALVRVISGYALLMGAGTGAMNAFLPLYVAEGVGLGAARGGAAAAVMGGTGIIGRIALSRAVEEVSSFLVPLAWLGVVSAISGVALLTAPTYPALVWLGACLAGIGVGGWNAVAMLAIVVRVPGRYSGRATGLVFFGFMAGYTLSPVAVGATVDATGQWSSAWFASLSLFALAGALAFGTRHMDAPAPMR